MYTVRMSFALEGRAALVTGASKGIGKGIAIELARAGCDIAVNYNSDQVGAETTAAAIKAIGRTAEIIQANVGAAVDVDRMFAFVNEKFPKLDILVNNAGVQTWKALLDLQESEWDRVIRYEPEGHISLYATRRAQDERQWPRFYYHIGSGCNKVAFPHLVDYTASKGGIEMFTKVAAVELGQYKIRGELRCSRSNRDLVHRTRSRKLRGDVVETDTSRARR